VVNTSAAISTGGELSVDTSSLHSTSNRKLSCPRKVADKSCHLENESLINRIVNSHSEKERRLSSPISCCTYTDHSNSPGSSFCCNNGGVGLLSGDLKMNAELCCTNMKMSGDVKLGRNHKQEKVSAKKSMQKKGFLISCVRCKRTALGLIQNGFLVTCSQSSSSKFNVAHLVKHGLSTVHFPEDGTGLASPPVKVEVMDCDASSLNLNIVGKLSSQGFCSSF
jgi:fanconi anemia group J protein